MPDVSAEQREAAVVSCVHRKGYYYGLTVREIWVILRDPGELGDQVTVQAYHAVVDRLIKRGVLVAVPALEGEARKYKTSDSMRVSLEDIDGAVTRERAAVGMAELTGLGGSLDPGSYAGYMDAQLTFQEKGPEVLKQVVRGLLEEDPVELVLRMFRYKVAEFNELAAGFSSNGEKAGVTAKAIKDKARSLRTLVHSHYGVSVKDFPTAAAIDGGFIEPDWDAVTKALRCRVFGEKALYWTKVETEGVRSLVVGGSDGSSHSMRVSGFPELSLLGEESGLVLTFNNALAALSLPDSLLERFPFPYHSVPLSRAAFDDPENFAMVMTRMWYPELTDVSYEHLKQAALELVQCQVDERVVRAVAYVAGDVSKFARGRLLRLPRPVVHFRDGLVTPQVRELMWERYCEDSVLGEVYRQTMGLWWSMLQAVAASEGHVLAGVVKSTQMRAFGELVDWYIYEGSRYRSIHGKADGDPIYPNWRFSDFSRLSDHQVMTKLMAVAGDEIEDRGPQVSKEYLCSFAIVRPFPQLDVKLRYMEPEEDDWVSYFVEQQREAEVRRQRFGGEPHYLEGKSVADDPYVQMCRKADYVSFYIGHTGGDPAGLLPRYEFLDSLRVIGGVDELKDRIRSRVQLVVKAAHDCEFTQDRDHSFMLDQEIVRILPLVVYDAHEKSKVWGANLSLEFRAAVFERLAALRSLGGVSSWRDLEFEAITAADYISRVVDVLRNEGFGEQLALFGEVSDS